MPKQKLDDAEVCACIQQVSGERMPQTWGLTRFLMPTFLPSCGRSVACRTGPWEPGFSQEITILTALASASRCAVAQKLGREHHLPGPLSLPFPHPNQHPLAVDIGEFELQRFGTT